MQIAKNAVVTIQYSMKNQADQVIGSTESTGPLVYLHGIEPLVTGLQKVLEGKSPGDQVSATLAPEDAFGARDERLKQSVPRSAFQSAEVKIGQQFESNGEQGRLIFTVTQIEGDTVTVDANHGLAGQTVTFDVTIKDVRAATPEELSHGHVHGPGGHHHH